MTTAPLQDASFALSRLLPSKAHADVREFGDRTVVWVEFEDSDELIRLTSGTSSLLAVSITAALDQRIPLVIVMSCAGADIVEGIPALHGWGLVAAALTRCSGVIPTAIIVDGPAVSGPALLLGIADIAVMTADSYAFVQGPTMVEQFTGVGIDIDELGGAANHARYTGVPSAVVADRSAAIETVESILAYLPNHVDEEPPRWTTDDPADRPCPEAGAQIPESSTGSYDVRKVAAAIVDEDSLFELRDRWAANVVTAFATIDGRPVGIVANQPISLAGTLDIPASQKSARFVAFCDAFNLPIITLVDTPGFYPGKDLEWRGMIRHGAQLVFAYARGHGPAHLRDPAQELRRRVHRHGLQDDGQRSLPRMALGRDRRHGRRPGSSDPRTPLDARRESRIRTRLCRTAAQPLCGRRARVHRRGDRPG